jgi:hypothetical protein
MGSSPDGKFTELCRKKPDSYLLRRIVSRYFRNWSSAYVNSSLRGRKMKKKHVGSLLCIALACITLIGARYQEKPLDQTMSQLRINNAGALQSLYDQSGREMPGGGNHAMREGYAFLYHTTQGERLVYAVGNQMWGLTGQETMPATGETATAIAKTSDGILEISSAYKLDVEKNVLSIIRRIRNVSSELITLSLAQNYVDPRLFSDPEGISPGQASYSGAPLTTPNQILDEFLAKDMGMIFFTPSACSTIEGEKPSGCPPPPPCTLCLPPSQMEPYCDLCQQIDGPDAESCCAEGSLESIRPQARIYSTRVGPSVYYDAAMSFLPETAVLTLPPPSNSPEESKKSRAYLIIQIQLPAKFK